MPLLSTAPSHAPSPWSPGAGRGPKGACRGNPLILATLWAAGALKRAAVSATPPIDLCGLPACLQPPSGSNPARGHLVHRWEDGVPRERRLHCITWLRTSLAGWSDAFRARPPRRLTLPSNVHSTFAPTSWSTHPGLSVESGCSPIYLHAQCAQVGVSAMRELCVSERAATETKSSEPRESSGAGVHLLALLRGILAVSRQLT